MSVTSHPGRLVLPHMAMRWSTLVAAGLIAVSFFRLADTAKAQPAPGR